MIQPTTACADFCSYILLQIPKRLTEGRKTLVLAIQTAAIDVTPITEDDWENFNLTALDYYTGYLIYSTFAV